mmetsp:Transcript_8282/g.18538  ORF Transcript_8282/g.18538 Transcript_8282/m.18538 type:complete len:169 (+) Transcript_8282:106-612(+)
MRGNPFSNVFGEGLQGLSGQDWIFFSIADALPALYGGLSARMRCTSGIDCIFGQSLVSLWWQSSLGIFRRVSALDMSSGISMVGRSPLPEGLQTTAGLVEEAYSSKPTEVQRIQRMQAAKTLQAGMSMPSAPHLCQEIQRRHQWKRGTHWQEVEQLSPVPMQLFSHES